MKFQETYKITLALLATLLAVIGTTATVVHADGPPNEAGDAPGDLLNDEQMTRFNNLSTAVQQMLADEFIPFLTGKGFDETSKSEFLAQVVEAEHATAEQMQADVAVAAKNVKPGGRCYLTGPSIYHNNTTVSTYGSVSCTVSQRALTSTSELVRQGYTSTSSVVRKVFTKNSWSSVVKSYASGKWNACAGFQASPKTGYAYAQPPSGLSCVTGYKVP